MSRLGNQPDRQGFNYFLRGDAGSGGTASETPLSHALPDRAPDSSVTLSIMPRAALIYRLSGDYNPIQQTDDR